MSAVEERVWRWNVEVVSVAGRLGNVVMEGERDTFYDLQRVCKRSLGCFVSPVQKWFVGNKRCVPMRELASVLTPGEVISTVTVVQSDHLSCRACSARGLFGRAAWLSYCSRHIHELWLEPWVVRDELDHHHREVRSMCSRREEIRPVALMVSP